MDMQYILEFLELAQSCSFSSTAEQFGITQSTLSKHMKQLESELGTPLLTHINKKTRLNEFGELFLVYAKQIAETQKQFFTAINRRNFVEDKILRIGVPFTMEYYDKTDIITKFQQAYPGISVDMIEGETGYLQGQVLNNKIDLAFAIETSRSQADGFSRIPFSSDVLVALIPRSNPLSKHSHVTLQALQNENFLLLPEDSIMHEFCLKLFQAAGISPNIIFNGTGESVFKAVSAGLGISLLSKQPLNAFSKKSVAVVDIKPTIPTYINMLYLHLEPHSASEKFVQFMQPAKELNRQEDAQ